MDIQEKLRRRLATENRGLSERLRQSVEIASDLPASGERPDGFYIYDVEKSLSAPRTHTSRARPR
jgi:hypothetical protein